MPLDIAYKVKVSIWSKYTLFNLIAIQLPPSPNWLYGRINTTHGIFRT
jgi:hypothetical protein